MKWDLWSNLKIFTGILQYVIYLFHGASVNPWLNPWYKKSLYHLIYIDNISYTNDSGFGRKGWEDAFKKGKKTSRNKYFLKECFNKKRVLSSRAGWAKYQMPSKVLGRKPLSVGGSNLNWTFPQFSCIEKSPVFLLLWRQTCGRWPPLCDSLCVTLCFSLPQIIPSVAVFLTLLFIYHKIDHSSSFSTLFLLSLCGVCVCGWVWMCVYTLTHFNKITNLSLWESLFPPPEGTHKSEWIRSVMSNSLRPHGL